MVKYFTRIETKDWVDKAKDDFIVVEREASARKKQVHDAVCFHGQQCAEKYLKAIISDQGLEVGKIHNLAALLDMVVPFFPLLGAFRADMIFLSGFAVGTRYPGESTDRQDALSARKIIRVFRRAAREALGLPLD